ncbi:MAG: serine--tRNA ligase [Nanoarchaeota archaeon]|nr:serine--tRNA ligase [Nanoarchaeota archaeon]
MLDIKLVRNQSEIVKKDLKRRKESEKIGWVEDLIRKDAAWRKSLMNVQKLQHKRNVVSKEISKLKGRERNRKIAEMRSVNSQIDRLNNNAKKSREKAQWYLDRLPNLMHESVPYGKDDSANQEIRRWGEKPKFSFKPRDHIELMEKLGLLDLERAAKVSGSRFYYLKGAAVKLDLALINFALDFLNEKGFKPVLTPVIVNLPALYGTGFLPLGEEDIYRVGEDQALIGTSEVALGAMHMNEILDVKDLPLRYAGFSQCFRTEAGSHGRDTKGIYRVHQFNKVEQFVFCKPEDSWNEHESMIKNVEKIFQKLKLHYRIVNMCTGDLGWVAAKKYDLEAWLPNRKSFAEVASCSNCTDYQARRLNVRFKRKQGVPNEHVHTLNSTALATTRTIVAIIENYQQRDGSIKIPNALQPYMNGLKKVG